MTKKITFNEEMRKSLMEGVNKTVDAVAQTLGPAGRTVIIEESYGPATVTRDGVTVAKAITLEDPLENMGAQLIKNIASQTDDNVGDGTTTSSILAQSLLKEGVKAVSTGVNPIMLRNGMTEAVTKVVDELKAVSKEIESKEQIERVATISANNDSTIGKLIADAIEKVGSDGVITVGESKTMETYTEYVEGMCFDKGYISPYFCTNQEEMTVEFEKPLILITDKTLANVKEVIPVLEIVAQSSRPLLIIAPSVEGELLTTLILNNLRGTIKVCAVKAPGFGDRQKDMIEDVAILTGATAIKQDLDMKFEDVTFDMLGSCKSVKVTKDNTTIVDGEGDSDAIKDRVQAIRRELLEATSDYDKEKLQERIAKLAGGVAVINIGDVSEAASKEKKYRIEDAINAVRAAIEEGIVPGGGTALCQIANKVTVSDDVTDDWKRGFAIVINSLKTPIMQIAENAGLSGEVVADKVGNSPDGVGFNALTGEYVNMIDDGILDPTKVTRCALENAASVASLILTSGSAITTIPEPKTPQPSMQQPMM
jgi:chaperonin GroEL